MAAYRHWSVPGRIEACGRTFGHKDGSVGAGPFKLAEIQKVEGGNLQRIRTLGMGREVWARPGCGLGVFLKVGDDRFLGYGLLGGP